MRVLLLLPLLILLGCSKEAPKSRAMTDPHFSFGQSPSINPRIIQDLATKISDQGDQVVAINLTDSQTSNRYFGEVKRRVIEGQNPFVYFETDGTSFGYQYLGKTSSGIIVLLIVANTGGSSYFRSLMLLKLESDRGLVADWERGLVGLGKERVLIRKLAEIELGDGVGEELKMVGDEFVQDRRSCG